MARKANRFNFDTTYSLEVEMPDDTLPEFEFEVSAHVNAYDPGRLSGPPENCYPPEGGDCDDIALFLDGRELTEEEFKALGGSWDKLRASVEEAFAGQEADYPDDRDPCDYDDYDRSDYFGNDD